MTDERGGSPADRPPRQLLFVASASLICAAHFATFDAREAPLATDVRYYVYFAWRVAEGAVPHLDFFGNKTQLAAFVGGGLYRLGEVLGCDPLLAIRGGYLAFATVAGVLAAIVHRRLAGGRASAGLLGALAYCSFPLLGALPAIGNPPKLLMALAASVMGLCVQGRRWFWAGFASALAFMDWQVGGLAGGAALVCAFRYGAPRGRASLGVMAGGVAGLAPFAAYYALHGGLLVSLEQTIGASLFRGSASLARRTVADRLDTMMALANSGGLAQPLFVLLGALGIGVAAHWLWSGRRRTTEPLLVSLGLYHLGVVAFSFVDFQWLGDFFVLLHSVAFFLALAWTGILEAVLATRSRGASRPFRDATVTGLALLLAVALARPGPLRVDAPIPMRDSRPGTTLSEQRQVAVRIGAALGERRIVFLDRAEMAFLMRVVNPLPYVYWNAAAWGNARRGPGEAVGQTATRLLRAVAPDAYCARRSLVERLPGFRPVTFRSDSGRYSVTLEVRVAASSPAG